MGGDSLHEGPGGSIAGTNDQQDKGGEKPLRQLTGDERFGTASLLGSGQWAEPFLLSVGGEGGLANGGEGGASLPIEAVPESFLTRGVQTMKKGYVGIGVKVGILAVILLVGLLGVSCSQGYTSANKSAPTTYQPPTSSEGTAQIELIPQGQRAREQESNGITIQAVPQGKLLIGAQELIFDITMDTHSVNLDVYDLASLATLRDNQGRAFKPASWKAPKGGHHRSGVLTFRSEQPLLNPDTQYIELLIRDVADTPERVLRWELRPGAL